MLQFFGEQPNCWSRLVTGHRLVSAFHRASKSSWRWLSGKAPSCAAKSTGAPKFPSCGFPWEAWPCFFHGFSMERRFLKEVPHGKKETRPFCSRFKACLLGGMGTENKTRYVETISSWCSTLSWCVTKTSWLGNTYIYIDVYSIHLCLV